MGRFDASKDYYSILGASRSAPRSEIERLYKRLAVNHHPDRGGSEERMKLINEAYGVLRHEEIRRAYDIERASLFPEPTRRAAPYPYSPPETQEPLEAQPAAAEADAIYGRWAGALLMMAAGLVLLLLVRFQWMWFLWPLAILAAALVGFGVLMAHSAMRLMRESLALDSPVRGFRLAQEALFWSAVGGGVYVVYLLLTAL
ncbi:MAG TPA: DnaJ domain-containing protein [Pyrinomonadaceae bacterium]